MKKIISPSKEKINQKKESKEKKLKVKDKVGEVEKKDILEEETNKFNEFHPLLTKENFHKVTVSLSKEELEFIENLSLKAKATGGDKLAKGMIIRGFVKAFLDHSIDTTGLKRLNDKILLEKMKSCMKEQK